jgi:hypothetical protein
LKEGVAVHFGKRVGDERNPILFSGGISAQLVCAQAAQSALSVLKFSGALERMEKLRRRFDLRNDRRKLYGAVSAAILSVQCL